MVLKIGDKVFALRNHNVVEVEFIKYSKRGTSAFFKTESGEQILVTLHNLFETKEEAYKIMGKPNINLKIGDKIYFQYSKYSRDREGEIEGINTDGSYKVSYFDADCGKTLYRDVSACKIRLSKSKKTIKREQESQVISEICHKIWTEFDVEIPFLSRPHSIEDAKKLYQRLKREYQSI